MLKASFSAHFNLLLNSPVPPTPSPSVPLRPSVDVLRQLGAQSGSEFDGFKSWTASGAPAKCSKYYGVTCDKEGKIVAIYVPSARLVGPIDALSSLDQLQRLELSYNNGVEALPQSFTKLKKLKLLNVNSCSIKGRIPTFLGQLTALTYLGIGVNSFEGAVPSSLGSLVNLVFLNIGGTGEDGVGGALPASFANLTKLKELCVLRGGERGAWKKIRDSADLMKLKEVCVPRGVEGCVLTPLLLFAPSPYLPPIPSHLPSPLTHPTYPPLLSALPPPSHLPPRFLPTPHSYLHDNRFSGPLPDFIGSFTKLEQL
ncbi:unnamed protein product [Closterium sp. Naga37s-1]|nr:unnamed protein product [Closterium sp. Naga37s-1]